MSFLPPRREAFASACSTPFASAPSSPGREPAGYFHSAPASPMHFLLSSEAAAKPARSSSGEPSPSTQTSRSGSFEFFSRFEPTTEESETVGSMCSADELFLNGQIRPMRLSAQQQRPQILSPMSDPDDEDVEDGSRRGTGLTTSGHRQRKSRSLWPVRRIQWRGGDYANAKSRDDSASMETRPFGSTSSSSSSSSSGRSSKWVFLKGLVRRSRSEERTKSKSKLLPMVSLEEEKKLSPSSSFAFHEPQPADNNASKSELVALAAPSSRRPANGVSIRRRVTPSAHEVHYAASRAQTEEMMKKKKTFLPYKQGLFLCLGFSSRRYAPIGGFCHTS